MTDGNDADSMEEIFAEESDPDDYDYDEGITTTACDNNSSCSPSQFIPMEEEGIQGLVDSFDPQLLSQPQSLSMTSSSSFSMKDMALRIKSLLQELSYSRLSALTPHQWNQWNVSSTLVQLTLTLLQLATNSDTVTDNSNGDNDDYTDLLSMEFMKPLLLLQDRVLDRMQNDNNNNSNFNDKYEDDLDVYLNLIRKLLTSDANDVGDYASKNKMGENDDDVGGGREISPSRSVGLSSLSSLVTTITTLRSSSTSIQKKRVRAKVREFIIKNFDNFIDSIEHVQPKQPSKYEQKNNILQPEQGGPAVVPTWVRVTMALLPILDFLTGVKSRSDYSLIMKGADSSSPLSQAPLASSNSSLSSKEAQNLLQTGLFRELVLLYTRSVDKINVVDTSTSITTAKSVVREQLLRIILVLSAQSTTILGKYIARVPDLTNLIYEEAFLEKNGVDGVLWYTFLSYVSTSNTSATTIILRKKGSTSLTPKEMDDRCLSGSLELFEKCSLKLMKAQEQKQQQQSDTIIHQGTYEVDALMEFIRFSNCCINVSSLSDAWAKSIQSQPSGKKSIQDALTKIVKNLSKVSVVSTSSSAITKDTVESDAEKKKDHGKKKSSLSMNNQNDISLNTLASMRKGAKSLLLLIDNAGPGGTTSRSQIDPQRISSKTD